MKAPAEDLATRPRRMSTRQNIPGSRNTIIIISSSSSSSSRNFKSSRFSFQSVLRHVSATLLLLASGHMQCCLGGSTYLSPSLPKEIVPPSPSPSPLTLPAAEEEPAAVDAGGVGEAVSAVEVPLKRSQDGWAASPRSRQESKGFSIFAGEGGRGVFGVVPSASAGAGARTATFVGAPRVRVATQELVAFSYLADHMPACLGERLETWRESFTNVCAGSLARDLKMALAGGLAGAVATAALFPIDTAKTLRQANPQVFHGTREALAHIYRTRGVWSIYTGLPTAVLGAMPSSALYFGTYEAVKTRLMKAAAKAFPAPGKGVTVEGEEGKGNQNSRSSSSNSSGSTGGYARGEEGEGRNVHPLARAGAHALAAACGNAASSLVFVPKEYVKQTLQASSMGAAEGARETAREIISRTLRKEGLRGLYRGYRATLSRNIPSAVIRFSLYEEIKLVMGPSGMIAAGPTFLLAGALAGACASGITTPFDVLKTRVATGSLEGSKGLARNMASIVAESGWKGLYVGFQPRVVMSGLFTAVGFTSFETFKGVLGVSSTPPRPLPPAPTKPPSSLRSNFLPTKGTI